ncbi:MAG: HAD family phosphatase [Deltaproteobacteria bacterium]|nr:HAD family phosphatase [Deltaproteobacteria bacterium]
MKPIIKAVLWDMDGVLINSEPLHFETLAEVVRNYGFDYTEEINLPFFGMRDIDVFKKLA